MQSSATEGPSVLFTGKPFRASCDSGKVPERALQLLLTLTLFVLGSVPFLCRRERFRAEIFKNMKAVDARKHSVVLVKVFPYVLRKHVSRCHPSLQQCKVTNDRRLYTVGSRSSNIMASFASISMSRPTS